jgi:hypothetical protein
MSVRRREISSVVCPLLRHSGAVRGLDSESLRVSPRYWSGALVGRVHWRGKHLSWSQPLVGGGHPRLTATLDIFGLTSHSSASGLMARVMDSGWGEVNLRRRGKFNEYVLWASAWNMPFQTEATRVTFGLNHDFQNLKRNCYFGTESRLPDRIQMYYLWTKSWLQTEPRHTILGLNLRLLILNQDVLSLGWILTPQTYYPGTESWLPRLNPDALSRDWILAPQTKPRRTI